MNTCDLRTQSRRGGPLTRLAAAMVVLALVIGPTGNLRAPTARIGKTLVVGFNEEMYRELLGT